MNKYYQTLDKILQTGEIQTNRKVRIKYLLNERLMLTPADSVSYTHLEQMKKWCSRLYNKSGIFKYIYPFLNEMPVRCV